MPLYDHCTFSGMPQVLCALETLKRKALGCAKALGQAPAGNLNPTVMTGWSQVRLGHHRYDSQPQGKKFDRFGSGCQLLRRLNLVAPAADDVEAALVAERRLGTQGCSSLSYAQLMRSHLTSHDHDSRSCPHTPLRSSSADVHKSSAAGIAAVSTCFLARRCIHGCAAGSFRAQEGWLLQYMHAMGICCQQSWRGHVMWHICAMAFGIDPRSLQCTTCMLSCWSSTFR